MSTTLQARRSDLPTGYGKRARAVRRSLSDVWLCDDYLVELTRRLGGLFPESAVTVHTRGVDGTLDHLIHDLTGPVGRTRLTERAMGFIESSHRYLLRGKDRFANRPVGTAELFAGTPEVIERFRGSVLNGYGAHFQLRVALYDGDRFVAFCGFLRPRSHGDFTVAEVRMFDVVCPALSEGAAISGIIGEHRSSSSQLSHALEAFEEPAFLVSQQGAVLFANGAARRCFVRLPGWLQRAPRTESTPRTLGRVARLDLDGHALWLVVPRVSRRARAGTAASVALEGLPPSLARVAELMVAGLADKEIAVNTGLSVSTVRTYVTRVYRRLGVHGRSELMGVYGGAWSRPATPRRRRA